MIYSDKKKFIFFAAGKTGTTSIEKALEEFADEIPFEYDKKIFDKHIPPEYAKAHLPKEIWDTYYKIAFVVTLGIGLYPGTCLPGKQFITLIVKVFGTSLFITTIFGNENGKIRYSKFLALLGEYETLSQRS